MHLSANTLECLELLLRDEPGNPGKRDNYNVCYKIFYCFLNSDCWVFGGRTLFLPTGQLIHEPWNAFDKGVKIMAHADQCGEGFILPTPYVLEDPIINNDLRTSLQPLPFCYQDYIQATCLGLSIKWVPGMARKHPDQERNSGYSRLGTASGYGQKMFQ